MARSVNKLILVGNVGRDPEVQKTSDGNKVAHFSLATSRRIPRENGFEERTEWHRLTVWGKLAELAEEYIRRGDRLYVEGRVQYDSYERNGITIPTSEVVVTELVMLGGGRNTLGSDNLRGSIEEAEEAEEVEAQRALPTTVLDFLRSCARELDGTRTGEQARSLLESAGETAKV